MRPLPPGDDRMVDHLGADGSAVRPGGNGALTRRSQVLFEGELIGCEPLRERLNAPSFATPEELLCTALAIDGPGGLATIDGVFAFAQACPSTTHLYSDPSGLRALYWGRAADERPFYSASPFDVHVSTAAAPRLSRHALHEYLRFLDVSAPRSIVHAVQALEPGVLLTIRAANAVRTEISRPSPRALPSTFPAAVDTLAELLEYSVARHLRDTRRAAAFLSGGIDSALVCALAARQDGSVDALTVGFDVGPYDESPAATRIAQHLGLRHEVLHFGRQAHLAAFGRLARGMDQPMADPATMATLLAFEHCRELFDVVLDGTGADEAVGAMPPRHVRLAVEYGSRLPVGLRRVMVRAMSRVPALAGYTPILDFEHPAETLMRWKGFTRAEIEELCGEPVSLEDSTFYRTFARFPRHAHFERCSALLNAMPCDRLTQAMKLTGLRVRFPYCARDVDGFLRQLPTEWRYIPGQPKRILRELLARYVPRELWDAPKRGFTFPLDDFLAGDSYALVHQHVLDGRWLGRGLLRPEVVRRYARAYIGGDRRLMFRVWALVVLGAWLDAHEDLIIPPPGA